MLCTGLHHNYITCDSISSTGFSPLLSETLPLVSDGCLVRHLQLSGDELRAGLHLVPDVLVEVGVVTHSQHALPGYGKTLAIYVTSPFLFWFYI